MNTTTRPTYFQFRAALTEWFAAGDLNARQAEILAMYAQGATLAQGVGEVGV